jgi:hypothetical protein
MRASGASKATKQVAAVTTSACEWLDALASEDGEVLLQLPAGAEDGAKDVVRVRTGEGTSCEVPARVWRLSGAAAVVAAEEGVEERRWFARGAGAIGDAVAYGISPSNAALDWPELVLPTIGEIVKLPGAMPIDGKVAEYNVLGDAVHAFFAADVEGLSAAERVERARRLLASARLVGVVSPEALVEASDRLRAFVDARWPGAVWHREVAIDTHVASAHGPRRVAGVIDLLLETPECYVVFDHKTFPARSEAAWRGKVVEFFPQFAAYAAALRSSGYRRMVAGSVHLPSSGAMIEVVLP